MFLILGGCFKNPLIKEYSTIIHEKSLNKKKYDIPMNGMIFVKENQTIYSIANEYNVTPNDIINDNNLIKPYKLKNKQILFLRNDNIYIIKENDTLNSLSIQFAVNKSDIVTVNKLRKPFKLIAGNKIKIPRKKNYSKIDEILKKNDHISLKSNNKTVFLQSNRPSGTPKFIWPVKGEVTKNFGAFGLGLHYDGIDIRTKSTIPIYASLSGKVVFVGSQIQKFGNLVLLKHSNGWLTAYSNVGNFNVKEGDVILKGHIIAYSSENNKSFHFQIRYKRNPVDPLKYLD